jgi:polyferredoxin
MFLDTGCALPGSNPRMPLGTARERLLAGLSRVRRSPHCYTWWRIAIGTVFTSLVLALPLSGLFHFDLGRGAHTVAGETVDFTTAAKRFAFPFLGINVLILLATRFLGRYLCGFVCPVGSLARLFDWARSNRRHAGLARAACALVALLLGYAVLAFWCDVRVLIEGTPLARALAAGAWLVLSGGLYWLCVRVGLAFCQRWCPSGVYFAVLAHEGPTGIELANPQACTDCGACDSVCPMDLEPRRLAQAAPREERGWYGEGFSNASLCIRCGDCVQVCEGVNAKTREEQALPVALRMGFLRLGSEPDGEERESA